MHEIEPFPNWLHLYNSEEDNQSPLFGQEPNAFEFSNTVYNYYIHPLWDAFGSRTLYLKILFADYEDGYAIIEFIGEWNDAVENDIMELKREIIDPLLEQGIRKFLLITENVMNFHSSDDSYYEEWKEDVGDKGGWIVFLNNPEHTMDEYEEAQITSFANFLYYEKWRTHLPGHLYHMIDNQMLRLGEGP